jgi:hypothetical protein
VLTRLHFCASACPCVPVSSVRMPPHVCGRRRAWGRHARGRARSHVPVTTRGESQCGAILSRMRFIRAFASEVARTHAHTCTHMCTHMHTQARTHTHPRAALTHTNAFTCAHAQAHAREGFWQWPTVEWTATPEILNPRPSIKNLNPNQTKPCGLHTQHSTLYTLHPAP